MKFDYLDHDLLVITAARLNNIGFPLPPEGLTYPHELWRKIKVTNEPGQRARLTFHIEHSPRVYVGAFRIIICPTGAPHWVVTLKDWLCHKALPEVYPQATMQELRKYNLIY